MKGIIGIAIIGLGAFLVLILWPQNSDVEKVNEDAQELADKAAEALLDNDDENTPEETPEDDDQSTNEASMQEDTLSFTTTDSGLQYAVITEGDGATQPTVSDTVKVHYHGTLDDGTVFDSSVDRGEPIEFPLANLIPGWQEGIPLMSVGAKYRFIIPPELAYGPAGGHRLGGQTLTFDVELLDVVQ